MLTEKEIQEIESVVKPFENTDVTDFEWLENNKIYKSSHTLDKENFKEYRRSLLTISEILISYSKGHISDEGLVEEIKAVLKEVL